MPNRHPSLSRLRTTLKVGAVLILLFSISAPNSAIANDKALAKEKYKEGLSHFQKEKYEDALEAFLESYELFPKDGKLLHIANCYEELYQIPDALRYFELYLDEAGDTLDDDEKKKIEKKIDRMSDQVGVIEIDDMGYTGELFVDGESVGKLPLEGPLYVESGKRVLTLEKDGDVVFEDKIVVEGGDTVDVEIAPAEDPEDEVETEDDEEEEEEEEEEEDDEPVTKKSGVIVVELTTEDTAIVYIDGKEAGETPFEEEYKAGEYEIEVIADDLPAWKETVLVKPGRETYILVDMYEKKKSPKVNNPMFWTGIGGFVPTLVAGIVLAAKAGERNDEASSMARQLDSGVFDPFPEAKDVAIRYQHKMVEIGKNERTGAIICLAGAGLFAIAAVVSLFIFRTEKQTAEATIDVSLLSPVFDPDTGSFGLQLSGYF